MEVKTVGLACDHAGYPLKKFVVEYLEKKGYEYKDSNLWQWGRHGNMPEQASGCACWFGMVYGNSSSYTSAQRCKRTCNARTFH